MKTTAMSSGSITFNTTYLNTPTNFRGYKRNKIIFMNYDFSTKGASITKDGTLLASGFPIPITVFEFPIIGISNNNKYIFVVRNKDGDGELATYNSGTVTFTAGNYFLANFIYIAA